ncbi:MAG: HDOD domain-containing protein [Burkholderiales bacterium]|nr:HDOD domain-containing protein [Burkholderiales bacterium]
MTSSSRTGMPVQISRFRILRTLGEGAQGIVYLGYDTQLERQVAIKTLRITEPADPHHSRGLIDSARTASSLSHPNIVQVFEVGVHEDQPYVVFEYIEGRNLADLLHEQGALPVDRAVVLMSQILAGLAQVHASGLLHGDIKPANILIGNDGVPRVADFGISRPARRAADEIACAGTVQYMAPECVSAGQADYRSDVFALGLMFHELLTGQPVFHATNDYARMYRILNEPVCAPSTLDARIDPRIDAIVLKAVQREPSARYANAIEMKADLDRYRIPHDESPAPDTLSADASTTLTFLLRRMSLKSDFPALSASFTRINELTSNADDTSMQAIADLVIRDFALTQKVLKIVNSAEFALGKVTRISQAISLIGIARLRSLAIGMMLAGGNRRGTGCSAVAAALTDFFVAGVIARNIGRMSGLKAVEELFICGMFSRLGQLLTLYYLRDEHDAIQRHAVDHGVTTMQASKAIMGLDYEELGTAVARRWNFPEVIVSAMRALPAGIVPAATNADERIWHCAAYARELCELARMEDALAREAAFEQHRTRFAQTIDVEAMQLRALLAHSMEAATKYVACAELDLKQTSLIEGLHALATCAANETPVSQTGRYGSDTSTVPLRRAAVTTPATMPSAPLAAGLLAHV